MRYKENIAPGNNAVIAAALSFIIPGAGKIYLKGFRDGFVGFILWFIFVTTGYVFLFLPGLILHIICVFTAYNSASSSKTPVPGALLTVLILFGGLGVAYYYSLPPEARSAFSFIGKALNDPDQLAEALNNEMNNLIVDMQDIVSDENTLKASHQIVISTLIEYADAEKKYEAAHGQYTRSTRALVDEGFLSLDISKTGEAVSSFYFGGYRFVHVRKQHTGYVDLKTGFVISAAPVTYKYTGISTYVIGSNGVVLFKDIKGNAVENVDEIDASWKPLTLE